MRLIKDPLLHFVALGALTFGVIQHFDPGSHRYEIDAGARERARLAALYLQQYGAAPTTDELQKLLDQYVRGEILYREGLALGLEQDDEIVRRRVSSYGLSRIRMAPIWIARRS
ncbi:MAG TPA: hypothetical protein VJQ47_03285 [Steroidobacteraceae bacterium]|nr:hypothetical protein [Steroidobacteraceae bacterium]